MQPLPAWIDREAWEDYEAMRRRIKKPMTARVIRQKLARLQAFKSAGFDVNEVIDEATNGHWLDFYATEKPIPQRPVDEAANTAIYLASKPQEFDRTGLERIKEELRRVKRGILGVK